MCLHGRQVVFHAVQIGKLVLLVVGWRRFVMRFQLGFARLQILDLLIDGVLLGQHGLAQFGSRPLPEWPPYPSRRSFRACALRSAIARRFRCVSRQSKAVAGRVRRDRP